MHMGALIEYQILAAFHYNKFDLRVIHNFKVIN